MIFKLDTSQIPDGAVLLFGIRYEGQVTSTVFTYAALKAGGRWYLTGSGNVPRGAGWSAVQKWLDAPGREVLWVRAVTKTEEIWPDLPILDVAQLDV